MNLTKSRCFAKDHINVEVTAENLIIAGIAVSSEEEKKNRQKNIAIKSISKTTINNYWTCNLFMFLKISLHNIYWQVFTFDLATNYKHLTAKTNAF